MKALRFHGNKDIRVDEVAEPTLKPGHVKIKNAWCGICGSDLHEYRIGPKNTPTKPHAITGETLPSIFGHEFSGTVVEVASDLEDADVAVGDNVAVFPVICDNTCYYCKQEVYGLCLTAWGFLGKNEVSPSPAELNVIASFKVHYGCCGVADSYSGFGGGMSEFIVVPAHSVHKLPASVSLEVGALVEPLAVGWHAVRIATHNHPNRLDADSVPLVLGAGPIGLAVIHALIAHNVKTIIVSEPSSLRAEQARAAAAGVAGIRILVANPTEVDIPEFVRQNVEGGYGAHFVFECAGFPQTFSTGLHSLRGLGMMVNVAIYEAPEITIPNALINLVNRRQLRIVGSNIYTRKEFQEVIDAIADGKIRNPETMITGRVKLDKAVKDGFEALAGGVEGHIKILIDPTSD